MGPHPKAYTHRIRSHAVLALWMAWATVFWGAVSVFILHSGPALPHAVQNAAPGSAILSFIGGCFGILYLLVARTIPSIVAGASATIFNIGYFWWFVAGLSVSPS
jgi:hypothetical protein